LVNCVILGDLRSKKDGYIGMFCIFIFIIIKMMELDPKKLNLPKIDIPDYLSSLSELPKINYEFFDEWREEEARKERKRRKRENWMFIIQAAILVLTLIIVGLTVYMIWFRI